MREPESKTIEGRKYTVSVLPTSKGLVVGTKIAKLAGPALGKATTLADAAARGGDFLATLAERLDDAEVLAVLEKLAEHTMVEVVPGTGNMVLLKDHFETHFAGDFLPLIEWARFAIGVNFGPLFKALGARARSAAAPGASAGTPAAAR